MGATKHTTIRCLLLFLSTLARHRVVAFSPAILRYTPGPLRSRGSSRALVARVPAMLVDAPKPEDSFGNVASECGPAAEFMAKLPPKLGDIAARGAVTAGALASLALAPGSMLVSAAAALVGGGLTRLTVAPLLVEGRYKALQYKVASLLDETANSGDWMQASREEVDAIVRSWGLPEDYNVALLSQIYARYLIELLKLPDVKLSEVCPINFRSEPPVRKRVDDSQMNQVLRLKDILGLSDEACGDAHYQAAIEVTLLALDFGDWSAQVYREVQWVDTETLDNPETYEHRRISKLFFLCRAVFVNSGSSDEATHYEMGRVRSVFSMSAAEMLARCDEVAVPFYEEALSSIVNNLNAGVSFDVLAKLRAKLGFSEEKASIMHRDVYSVEVNRLLENDEPNVLSEDEEERLTILAKVLALDDSESEKVSATQTRPRFSQFVRSTVVDDMEAGRVSPTEAAQRLAEARRNMRLSRADAETLIRECVRERFAGHVIDSVASAAIETREETANYIRTMITFKQGVDTILDTLGEIDYESLDEAKEFKNLVLFEVMQELQSAAREAERAELFQIALRNNVEDEASDQINLAFMKTLLGLEDGAVDRTYRSVVEPKLDEIVDPMIKSSVYDKTKLTEYIESMVYPAHLFREYALRKYEAQLKLFRAENPVITAGRRADLERLQEFFSLDLVDVKPIIKSFLFPVYKKSIMEAMGTSGGGIIIEEYKVGLEKLRERLGIDDADADEALRDAAADMMAPMFASIVAAFEESIMSKEQLAQKRGQDVGEDLFVSSDGGELGIIAAPTGDGLLKEVCNLIDFYVGNKLDTQSEVTAASSYIASKSVPDGTKAAVYKQCLVRFLANSERDDEIQQRYQAAMRFFPKILGLTPARAEAIRNDIGKDVATKFCKQALATKASLDATDLNFVNKVAEELDTDLSEVPLNAKKLTLVDRISKVRLDDSGEEIASIRDSAIAMGVDLSVDLKLSAAQLTELFKIEVKWLIQAEIDSQVSGQEATEPATLAETVSEIAEAYSLQSEAAALVTQLGAQLSDGFLESAQANSIAGRRPEATHHLDKLVACAKVVGPDVLRDALSTSIRGVEKTNQELVTLYSRTRSVDKERLDILKVLLEN